MYVFAYVKVKIYHKYTLDPIHADKHVYRGMCMYLRKDKFFRVKFSRACYYIFSFLVYLCTEKNELPHKSNVYYVGIQLAEGYIV